MNHHQRMSHNNIPSSSFTPNSSANHTPFAMAGNIPTNFGHQTPSTSPSSNHQGHRNSNTNQNSTAGHNSFSNQNSSYAVKERDELKKQVLNLVEECFAAKFSIENEKALHKQSLSQKAVLENKIGELNSQNSSLAASKSEIKRMLDAKYNEMQQTSVRERIKLTTSFNEQLLEKDKTIAQITKELEDLKNQIKELNENPKRPDTVSISPEEYQVIKNQIKSIKDEYLDFRNEAQSTIIQQCKTMKMNFNTILLSERERANQMVKTLQEFYSKKLSVEVERMREQQKEIENLAFESSGYSADLEETRKLLQKAQVNCSKLEASNMELAKKINKMSLKK